MCDMTTVIQSEERRGMGQGDRRVKPRLGYAERIARYANAADARSVVSQGGAIVRAARWEDSYPVEHRELDAEATGWIAYREGIQNPYRAGSKLDAAFWRGFIAAQTQAEGKRASHDQ